MSEAMKSEQSEVIYKSAMDIFTKEQAVSVSLLQRRMKIGYSVALSIVEKLEHSKLVTQPDAMGLRKLMPK